MFCSKCGNTLPENAKFCDKCGTPVPNTAEQSPITNTAPMQSVASDAAQSQPNTNGTPIQNVANNVAQPFVNTNVAPVQNVANNTPMNVMLQNFLATIKGFFSKDTVKTVANASKSTGLEWLLMMLSCSLLFAFSLAFGVKQILSSLLLDMLPIRIFNFGIWFLWGLIIGVGSFFLLSLAMFLLTKIIFKIEVKIQNIFNLVATACLPLGVAYIINIILGFVWYPLTIILSVVSLVQTAILLYVGIQKLKKLDKSPFWAYSITWLIVMFILVVVVGIIIRTAVGFAVQNAYSDMASGISNTLNFLR